MPQTSNRQYNNLFMTIFPKGSGNKMTGRLFQTGSLPVIMNPDTSLIRIGHAFHRLHDFLHGKTA